MSSQTTGGLQSPAADTGQFGRQVTQGGRGPIGRRRACLCAGFCKQSSRNAASCARSADRGISGHHDSFTRMVTTVALQIDALQAHTATQRHPNSLYVVCIISRMTCKPPVNVRRAGKHSISAVGRSRLLLHQAANNKVGSAIQTPHYLFLLKLSHVFAECYGDEQHGLQLQSNRM